MIGVTVFGIFLTPVFYVLLRTLAGNRPLKQHGGSTRAPISPNEEVVSTRENVSTALGSA